MIPLSLALAGCHVFEVVEIVCAGDEACADPPDTDTDTDTDTGTDTDTAIVQPTRGWVISGTNASSSRVLVFDPNRAQVAAWTDLGEAVGPVAYDPDSGAAYLASAGAIYELAPDGAIARATASFPDVLDLVVTGGVVYVATGDGLDSWSAVDDVADTAPFESPVSALSGVGLAADGSVYATDADGGAPDLYAWTGGGSPPTALFTDFDGSAARARRVFTGPDDAPYTCSGAGAFYAVAELAAGNSRPVAVYGGGLTDVTACAYDPGDASWLLFSPTGGVVRLDAQSRAEIVLEPSASYTLVRGGFY